MNDQRRVHSSSDDQARRCDNTGVTFFRLGRATDRLIVPGRSVLAPLCPLPSREGSCVGKWDRIHLRLQVVSRFATNRVYTARWWKAQLYCDLLWKKLSHRHRCVAKTFAHIRSGSCFVRKFVCLICRKFGVPRDTVTLRVCPLWSLQYRRRPGYPIN